MDPQRLVFLIIAGLGLGAAIGVVVTRSLVHAAFFLVAFFFSVACLFVLLRLDLLAAIQILISIGAVAVLILFGIMLTRSDQDDTQPSRGSRLRGWLMPASGLLAIVALAACLLTALSLSGDAEPAGTTPPPVAAVGSSVDEADGPSPEDAVDPARRIGELFMTRHVLVFELIGLLLTVALVGAIAIATRNEARDDHDATAATSTEPAMTGGDGHLPDGSNGYPAPPATAGRDESEPIGGRPR